MPGVMVSPSVSPTSVSFPFPLSLPSLPVVCPLPPLLLLPYACPLVSLPFPCLFLPLAASRPAAIYPCPPPPSRSRPAWTCWRWSTYRCIWGSVTVAAGARWGGGGGGACGVPLSPRGEQGIETLPPTSSSSPPRSPAVAAWGPVAAGGASCTLRFSHAWEHE